MIILATEAILHGTTSKAIQLAAYHFSHDMPDGVLYQAKNCSLSSDYKN